MTKQVKQEEKEEVKEEIKAPEYPMAAEICGLCGVVLLEKTGPEEWMFENTKAGKTKASPTRCRKCYDKEMKKEL